MGSCSVVLSQLFFAWTWLCAIPLLLAAWISNRKQLKAGDSLTFFQADGKLCWDFHNKLLLQLFKFASQKSYLKAVFSIGQWLPACSVWFFFSFETPGSGTHSEQGICFLIVLIGICLASGILIHSSIMAFKWTFPWRDIFQAVSVAVVNEEFVLRSQCVKFRKFAFLPPTCALEEKMYV